MNPTMPYDYTDFNEIEDAWEYYEGTTFAI